MYRVANDARIHFGELEEQSQDESRELSFQAINTKSAAIVIAAVLEKSKAQSYSELHEIGTLVMGHSLVRSHRSLTRS